VAAGSATFGPAGIFRFDALGRYRTAGDLAPGAALNVTVNGNAAFSIEQTGYAHP